MSFRRKQGFILQAAILFFLALALAVQIRRLMPEGRWSRIDLAGHHPASLSAQSQAFFTNLAEPLAITYFATPKQAMPAHMKGVESGVRALISAFQSRAPGQIDFRVIYPDASGKTGAVYAARKRVAPFSVRDVRHDEHSEQKIWSSMVLAYGDKPEFLIPQIAPEGLLLLESYILAGLDSRRHPPEPVIAVSAPGHFSLFKKALARFGRVREVDLSRSPSVPEEADVLFWLDPSSADQRHIHALQGFLARGRTAVLAGSRFGVDYSDSEPIRFHPFDSCPDWPRLLAPFGIRPLPDLLIDESHGPVFFRDSRGEARQADAPFHLRMMPGFYHLKGFLAPARGALNFPWASALELRPRKISKAGYQAQTLGTTTENTYVQPFPRESFALDELNYDFKVGKQNLMVRLVPDNPWEGELLVLATAGPFRDGIFNQPNYGHRVFLQTLLRTFTEPDRLLRGRLERPTPPPIPEMSHHGRLFWRLATVFLIPALFLLSGARPYLSRGLPLRRFRAPGFFLWRAGLSLLLVFFAVRLWSSRPIRLADLTRGRIHTPWPLSREYLAHAQLSADLILPGSAELPAGLKQLERSVTARLNDLGIQHTLRRPDQLSPQDGIRLRDSGLRPFEVRAVRHDAAVSKRVLSGLLLHRPGQVAAIPRLDDQTVDHLEFLLVTAAKRLETGKQPHIAFISETPRLSPAEAYEYHQQGLSPPRGADVFAEAQGLLRDYGYRVSYVDPRSGELPKGIDLVIWMQPRRHAARMIENVAEHLAKGGGALVGLQHFNIQQRQYRGAGFQTVYWPQPQFQDFNQYLAPLGLEQVREVLMDRTRTRLSLETQINRSAVREFEAQEVALPFLIRAVNAHFNPESPITRNLGDQLFLWGNRFRLHPDSLRTHGLRATPLISTSERSWAYDWSGGWLPEASFQPDVLLPGRQPLALLAEGRFPVFQVNEAPDGRLQGALRPSPHGAQGALLLVGSSEMFTNNHLYTPGFQHDQFLLNAVAHLTHGPAYAALQARGKASQGFPYLPPGTKALWRVFILGTGPVLILLYGFVRHYAFTRWHVKTR